MFSSGRLPVYGGLIARFSLYVARAVAGFFRQNWKGTFVIGAATLIFFAPFIARMSTFSVGGDTMMNAWMLARDRHCILRQNCPDFSNGNIYFPHEDSMLYSEVELTSGLLTLPLQFINPNPLFAYGVWTVASFFFLGFFMYLLAKRLSKGREFIPIVAGLAFEFAPMNVIGWGHLQNLNVFYLPLIILFVIRFLDTARRRYLVGTLVALVMLFYASWYQMVFGLIALGVFLLVLWVTRAINWRHILKISAVVFLACVCVLPLAVQYMNFSKTHDANFKISDQLYYSSSLTDYITPPSKTTVSGQLYNSLSANPLKRPYNKDNASYHGVTLYIVSLVLLTVSILMYIRRHKNRETQEEIEKAREPKYLWAFAGVAFVGFVASLGPALQISGSTDLPGVDKSSGIALAMPWLFVDLLAPQLQFIRAIGRITALALFGMVSILAFLPQYVRYTPWKRATKKVVILVVVLLLALEIMPIRLFKMCDYPSCNNHNIPRVYEYVAKNEKIDNLIVLRTMRYYPDRRPALVENRMEDMLWAGYHNKNIFNGYSGYEPPEYWNELYDFIDLMPDDVPKMLKLGIHYVVIDKRLSDDDSRLIKDSKHIFPEKLYEDGDYVLYSLRK